MRHSIGFIYSTLLTVLLCVGCTAGIQQMSQAKTGASGVEQVCQQGGLTGCAALGGGFEKFALNDPTSARAHIYVMLSQNPSLDATILSQALQRYAAGAGENSRAIGQFASFLASVGREMAIVRASMIAAADAPDQSESEPVSRNAENGQSCSTDQCVYDTQCKLDRVCIAGECVSPKYAKAVESQYMKNRNLQIDPTSTVSELPPPELQLLVPPLPDDPLCTPQKVSACMTRCERGNKESCYAVAKVYENLPPAARRSEYILYAYNKACVAGMSDACIHLGRLYFDGDIVPRQLFKAFHNNAEACKLGNSLGCANAALLQENGVGVVKDNNAAEQYFAMACTLGHDESCDKVQNDQPIFVSPTSQPTTP